MHPTESPVERKSTWRTSLAAAVRDAAELRRRLGLPHAEHDAVATATRDFPVLVPESFLRRMRPGDPHDPLLLQVLPRPEENDSPTTFSIDPVGDSMARIAPGLLHKYRSRVLLIAASACAVHCRYCFRRHYPYEEDPKGLDDFEPALDAIVADSTIREVILSGGDPLTRTDTWLGQLVSRIAAIGHIEQIRLHTRLPIVLPDRVDDALLAWLTGTRLQPVVVLHSNHPQELTAEVPEAIDRLRAAGIPLFNQAVLLRGINDSEEILTELSRRLLRLGVVPYYLHQLDRVVGSAHFEVAESVGVRLIEQLRTTLPGYLVPRFVREMPGGSGKEVIA